MIIQSRSVINAKTSTAVDTLPLSCVTTPCSVFCNPQKLTVYVKYVHLPIMAGMFNQINVWIIYGELLCYSVRPYNQ